MLKNSIEFGLEELLGETSGVQVNAIIVHRRNSLDL